MVNTQGEELALSIASLKSDINKAVTDAVRKFNAQTGLTPSDIDIEMVDITRTGDQIRSHAVGNVSVSLRNL